jgi:hypothetical protein
MGKLLISSRHSRIQLVPLCQAISMCRRMLRATTLATKGGHDPCVLPRAVPMLAPAPPNQASSAGEGLLPLALTARGTGGGSATGAGLVVAPRRLTAFAMRVAAETRAERLRAAGVVVEAALRRFLVGVAAAAVAGMAAPSEVGLSPVD